MTNETIEIRDAPERHRYELLLRGELAGVVAYARTEQRMTILHTEVDAAHDGRGLGSLLAVHALDDARARALRLTIECPFVSAYVGRHPTYADLLAAEPEEKG